LRIDNLKLRTKMLIPLALMAIGVLFVAAFGAMRLVGISATASEIIEHRQLAAIELNHAAQIMQAVPHAVFATLLYGENDLAGC
jgi:hypothetical protein